MVLLPAASPLAKAAAKIVPYCYKWAPYYALKFGVIYGVKKYPGGVPGLYRTSLRVVRRNIPATRVPAQQRAQIERVVQEAFRTPARAEAAVQRLDVVIAEVIRDDAQSRRDEGIPDEFIELLQQLQQKHSVLRKIEREEKEAQARETAQAKEAAAARAAKIPPNVRRHFEVLKNREALESNRESRVRQSRAFHRQQHEGKPMPTENTAHQRSAKLRQQKHSWTRPKIATSTSPAGK